MEHKSINFLRGVPAEEALAHIIPQVSDGYRKAIARYGTEVLQYGHFTGFKPLRQLIGNWHGADPERILIGNGGLEVISLFFKSLPRESVVIVEETSYDRVLSDAAHYGHRLIGVKLKPGGIDVDQFEAAVQQHRAAAFYGIPFHHNPTGINYTVETRQAVEGVCRKHKVLCLWDACYEHLRYDGRANDAIEISEWGPIVASSFTKTISPGTKCGYIIVPAHYTAHLSKVVANTRINPNLPTQAFIANFIESGAYDTYLDYLRQLYKPRMEALNHALAAYFPGAFPVESSGGFFAPLTFAAIPADKAPAFIESAKQAGVGIAAAWDAVAPNLNPEMQRRGLFIRLTFPAFAPEQIEWGLATLKETAARFHG